jgi:hypothetical protein
VSSKADQIKAKTQRIREAETSTNEDTPRASSAPKVRAKPVRRTVDLSPAHHAELDAWCAETARQLGRARVTGQDVLRTLVSQLLTDETLARKVRKALAEDQ